MSINLFQSSLWVINTHCFFFLNHTLLLCKAIVMTKQIFSSHKNPHYYYEKKPKQYINGNLRASRLLRSYLIDELKKLNFFLKNRKYNVKECSSNYCCSEKYIYTCLDKYFNVYFPCFWEIFTFLGYFVSSKVQALFLVQLVCVTAVLLVKGVMKGPLKFLTARKI